MPKVKSRGLDHSAKDFFMWFFMWFCKILCQNLVMFKYAGWFYLLATLLYYTKVVWTLKAQKIGILNDCTFCGKFFKTTSLKNHKRNHTKCQFWTERSDPLHWSFGTFFGLKWFLMGQILTCLVSLGFLVEKWPFCSTLVQTFHEVTWSPQASTPASGAHGALYPSPAEWCELDFFKPLDFNLQNTFFREKWQKVENA